MITALRCDGCLGTLRCWICTGDGCRRCQATGACHLCGGSRLSGLLPRQERPPQEAAVPQA